MTIGERLSKWWKGLRDDEWAAVSALRSLAQLLSTAPELAARLLDLLPVIVVEIKRIERALPGNSRGREKLVEFIAWLEHEHAPNLKTVASLSEIITAGRAIASLIVSVLNAAGMFRRNRE